jgi:preprotein translocase subunit SecA
MRVFGEGNTKMKYLMGKLGMEDEAIENKMITKSLEGAQEKIEGFNFDARKHVLEFDDVLNFQRKIVYGERRKILLGDTDAVLSYVREILKDSDESEKKLIEEKLASADDGYVKTLRQVILQTMDMFWVEHLDMMDYMRSSVNLRAYGQRDPLVEYKREGLQLFKNMQISINMEILKLIPQIQSNAVFVDAPVKLTETRDNADALTVEVPQSSQTQAVRTPDGEKVGRNDPCPCGSGKKFKKCGELNTEEHQKLIAKK